ncbi:MAG: hypothetical protein LUH58_01500 [Lachnospiraceae bacterium]|nr:hypothetical protein [Lachnospiraceae bacterium]
MEEMKKSAPLRMLVTITDTSRQKIIEKVLEEAGLPVAYQLRGIGTVKSEILKIMGLSDNVRILTFAVVPRSAVSAVFGRMSQELKLKDRGTGIAFTIPVNGTQTFLARRLNERFGEETMEKENTQTSGKKEYENAMVLIIANQGYNSEIMAAAREAGAYGGTVMKCRRQGTEKAMNFLGISLQEEQEMITLIVPKEIKHDVMQAVTEKWGIRSEAKAVVVSLPVDEVMGIQK